MISVRVGLLVVSGLFVVVGCAPPEAEPRIAKRHTNKAGAATLGDDDQCASVTPDTGGIAVRALDCGQQIIADEPVAVPPPVATTQTIKASLSVNHLPDTASNTNCLKIQVNMGPELDLGCNHGAAVPAVQIDALARPGCNQVRLILFSNGQKARSTESAINVAQDFRIARTPTGFQIQCNDNSDDDFNDLNVQISSADAALAIENTGFGCQ